MTVESDNDRWRRISRIYHSALTRGEDGRAQFIRDACAGDEALRQEIESLLREDGDRDTLLSVPATDLAEPIVAMPESSPIGKQLGAFKILALLGAGGMGEVYRARDTELGRDVAVKILPSAFVSDPERLARFEREARVLAALNHPHIAAIYGLERADSSTARPAPRALVLELVEGPTLKDLLDAGALPVSEALRIARQIADALDAAHEKGVIHRDLKPANIKVTPKGAVKVLDFGLAMVSNSDGSVSDLSQSPTVTLGGTRAGVILGTAPYMSPEQARGRPLDKRTDLWSFGCVFYEMLAGKPAFAAETVSDTIAAVLGSEPDWTALPDETPAGVRRLLHRALEKDVRQRLRDIGDVGVELDREIASGQSAVAAPTSSLGPVPARSFRWPIAAMGLALLIAVVVGALWLRPNSRPRERSEWVQLTNFPDSVAQPMLSPDGRMVTFIRGGDSFTGSGQIYVKILPNGEPKQLTRDSLKKMSPVFSPDGSRIAYTAISADNQWDTWIVPVLGGEPRLWLPNASGLVWADKQRLLFSEKIPGGQGNHMKIVTAQESRADSRDLYVPMPKGAMAHRSYASPDGRWVLVAEMTDRGVWTPCRLLPTDGSSRGRQVGPPEAPCWFGAWSPDGKWIYLSSSAGGAFHTWRQRFPEGDTLTPPEQVTSGPTEEEGIAMAPDGLSLITAVGLKQRSVWVHDAKGERRLSLEGYAHQPKFTPDGKKLLYIVSKGASLPQGELWVAELDSGFTEPLLPGFPIGTGAASTSRAPFDVSADGRQVVVESFDKDGKSRIWLATLDRRSPPAQVPNVEGDGPVFGAEGEILFRAREGDYGFGYSVRADGTGLRKVHEHPVIENLGVSPDKRWLVAYARPSKDAAGGTLLLPVGGGPPIEIWGMGIGVRWSQDRKLFFMVMPEGNTYALPLTNGRMLPEMLADGFRTEEEIANVPGVRVITDLQVAPGPTPDVYAFSRETVQRNLYRIPVP